MFGTNSRLSPFLLATALFACNGDADKEDAYSAPVANAGADQTATLGSTVTMDGSASTASPGYELAYTWAFEQVPIDSALDATAFSDNNSAAAVQPNFLPDVVGDYVLSLVVNDGVSTSNKDLAVVTVGSDNLPPIADAGPDQEGDAGSRVTLDGSGSSDPEGEPLTYEWIVAAKPSGSALTDTSVYDANTDAPSFVPDAAGTFVLTLVVSDGTDYSEPDSVSIDIAAENQAPVADAGASETLAPCADELQLNGNGSYDADGDAITYSWSVHSVPSGSAVTSANISDTTSATPTFTWDVSGSYTFALQVNDGELSSAKDLVTYVVVDSSSNSAPSANAGSDQTVEVTTDCTSSDYVWTCDPCEAADFEVDGTGSSDPDGDEISYKWSDSTGELDIDAPYLAWTTVSAPESEGTYGTTDNSWTLTLEVGDCSLTDSDTVMLTVSCTGEN